MAEVVLDKEQIELFNMMNISEQTAVKRLMWVIGDATDSAAENYLPMLEALFDGAKYKYLRNEE